jgi:cytochrome c-type biogenesis protein CcmE
VLGKKKYIIGGLILVIALAYFGFMAFQGSVTYYYTVSELIAQEDTLSGENVRVNGQVAADPVIVEPGSITLTFSIIEGNKTLPVVYQGAVPDTFKPGSDVVVEGHLNSAGIFQASKILTKCPSKYVPKE